MKLLVSLVFAGALSAPGAIAQTPDASAPQTATAGSKAASDDMADGEVRRIDKPAKKVTLRHGPIPNLEMPPMTMVFQVQNPGHLDNLRVGDKVRFRAEKLSEGYVVTEITGQ